MESRTIHEYAARSHIYAASSYVYAASSYVLAMTCCELAMDSFVCLTLVVDCLYCDRQAIVDKLQFDPKNPQAGGIMLVNYGGSKTTAEEIYGATNRLPCAQFMQG